MGFGPMPPRPAHQEPVPELAPLNAIRVETALSRYPVHRLAKKGSVNIDLKESNERGQTTLRWEVTHNSKFGQPGPLAYRLDTLIVNRRIEEASRPVPKLVKLGSLASITAELGGTSHNTSESIKKALFQNASAFITAKIRHKLGDGTEQTLEAGFNRYSVVFTGEKLPDGRKADGVYLVLSDVYMQVINGAMVRPLDYDYLRMLQPASQRFYELLSFQMYGALKFARPRARLVYSEYCTYAPQTRYLEFDRLKKQMHKVHAPHRKSGYIERVEYEATTDKNNQPDWLMLYVPGPKARAEYRAFAKKGGPVVLEIEPPTPLFDVAEEPGPLEQELIARGVTPRTATDLVRDFPEPLIKKQIEQLAWQIERKGRKAPADPAAYLVDAIRKDYASPQGFESKADRDKREEAKRERERLEAAAVRRKREARAAEQEQKTRIDAYLKGLSPTVLATLDQEALVQASPEQRVALAEASEGPIKRAHLRLIREAQVRRLLNLPELSSD